MNTELNSLEKGVTSKQVWLSDTEVKMLDELRQQDEGIKKPSDSLLLRLAFRSTMARIRRKSVSLKDISTEALSVPSGTKEAA